MLARFAKTNVLARFAKDESGNIITVLALSTLTLLGAVSGSLDYSRMTNTRAALAAAADAAALAAAQAPPAEAARLARQVFDANFPRGRHHHVVHGGACRQGDGSGLSRRRHGGRAHDAHP